MMTNEPEGFTRRQALLVAAAATAAACSSDPTPTPGADATPDSPGADVTGNDQPPAPDATPDAGPDAPPPVDAAPDVGPDAGPDVGPDAAPDVGPDAGPDVGPDAAPDVGPDAAPDAAPACPPAGAMRLGALTDFPAGSWRNVKGSRVIVGRDARGLFAYSSVCTHSGCTVPAPMAAGSGSQCPCHGSRYDNDGTVTGGPAARSLTNYRVAVCGGDVYLQMDMTVPVGTRTAV